MFGKKYLPIFLLAAILLVAAASGNGASGPDNGLANETLEAADTMTDIYETIGVPEGFVRGIVISLEEGDYYFDGPADGPDGSKDIPGHYWLEESPGVFLGLHYNVGPFGASSWWATNETNGELLYIVQGIMGTCEDRPTDPGYTHFHELVDVTDGSIHPTKVVWLKHVAVKSFNLDGGPMPQFSHEVSPGIDLEFMPNADMCGIDEET